MTTTTPRIYVASLSDYNAGRLHGCWIDLDADADTIRERIAEMLAASAEPGAEEWAIHDHEGFEGYPVSEHADLDELIAVAEGIEEHGEVFAELIANMGSGFGAAEAEDYMRDNYRGAFKSLADYCADMAEECGDLKNVPQYIRYHIDWEGVARDCKMSGDFLTIECGGEVHIFDNA